MNDDMAKTSDTLQELKRVRERVRRDRRPASIPLSVLTAAMALFTAMQWWGWATDSISWTDPTWFWVIAAPIGFAVAAQWYRKVERDIGVSTQRIVRTLAIAAFVSLLVFPLLGFPMGVPYAVLGTAFLVIGVTQRSGHLIAGALIFGVGGVLQSLFVISNRVYEVAGEYVSWASPASWTLVAVLLAGVTALAWREEVVGT